MMLRQVERTAPFVVFTRGARRSPPPAGPSTVVRIQENMVAVVTGDAPCLQHAGLRNEGFRDKRLLRRFGAELKSSHKPEGWEWRRRREPNAAEAAPACGLRRREPRRHLHRHPVEHVERARSVSSTSAPARRGFAHCTTRSARLTTSVGIATPICRAVFRFTMSSYGMTLSTGRSLGFAPLRILSMYTAMRRMEAVWLVP